MEGAEASHARGTHTTRVGGLWVEYWLISSVSPGPKLTGCRVNCASACPCVFGWHARDLVDLVGDAVTGNMHTFMSDYVRD
jgi:hypothetical protein